MLASVKISRRQSEIRQALAGLVGKDKPTDDETRQIEAFDAEFRTNETRYRAALIAEDNERREAGSELETRTERQFAHLIGKFEMRQVALSLDEGASLSGATAEVVAELRNKGGFRGVPVPWMALERRDGETVAAGVAAPVQTRPIIDRLFPDSVAGRMGVQSVAIDAGAIQWPVTTSSVSAGWSSGETGAVPGPTQFTTADRALSPDHNLGVTMKITRKALKQSGAALEDAIRRDMSNAMAVELDRAVFLGTGADGQPLGIIAGAATYGIASTAVGAVASWSAFRDAVIAFMTANAAGSPDAVRVMIRPELWGALDGVLIPNTAVSEWDRLTRQIPAGNIAMTSNALAAPAGTPKASSALLATSACGARSI